MSHRAQGLASAHKLNLPGLYAIVDSALLPGKGDRPLRVAAFAAELVSAGVTLIQYRNKNGDPRERLSEARELRRAVGAAARLIMNDRADLCLAAGFDGLHVGQEDISIAAARLVLGEKLLVGVSTHTLEQVRAAELTSADYIAIGPVFATATKPDAQPVAGLEGVRNARAVTSKPLVAIGGITRLNCISVINAGADSVAVISDLLSDPAKSAAEFWSILG